MTRSTTEVVSTATRVEITATTPVAAPAEAVWAVLTDFEAYPDWNPFVRRLVGRLEVGERWEADLQPGAADPRTMRPRLVAVDPGRSFTWLGRVGLPGVLDGRHTFTVEPDGEGSRLVQHEVLSGLLVPLFRRMLTVDTPAAFTASNDALADRVVAL